MATERIPRTATIGATEHGNSAVLVMVAPDGELLDRHYFVSPTTGAESPK